MPAILILLPVLDWIDNLFIAFDDLPAIEFIIFFICGNLIICGKISIHKFLSSCS